jgi:iron complex transport system substrate-binding protein
MSVLGALLSVVLAAPSPAPNAAPPRRVASLNLTADEVLVEILPPERLVAVTAFADETGTSNVVGRVPKGAVRFPKADVERLVALLPDLVVVSEYTDADFLKLLERSGVKVHRMSGLSTLDGYRKAILDLGREVGEPAPAAAVVARDDRVLADLGRRLSGVKRPRVLYWASGLTAGGDTAIGSLIECAGGANVGREIGLAGIAPIGAERAFVADPDVLLIGVYPGVREAVQEHPLLSRSRAVTQGRVVQMPTELLVALSQYAADACWDLAARLHPDRVPTPRP